MILVTVGTEKYPFNRLMQWINVLQEQGFLSEGQEEIIVQYGSCSILPAGVRVYDLVPEAKFQTLLQQARLIISHCGEGSLTVLDQLNVPYILVPRSSQFGEHVDEHQVELANALADMGVAIAWSPGDLVRFLAAPYRVPLSMLPAAYLPGLCQQLEKRFGQRGIDLPDIIPVSS